MICNKKRKAQVKVLEEKNANLSENVQLLKEQINKKSGEVVSYMHELKGLDQQNKALREEIEVLHNEIEKLKKEIIRLTDRNKKGHFVADDGFNKLTRQTQDKDAK